MQDKAASEGATKMVTSEAEWRELLTPEQLCVTRKYGTEPCPSRSSH
jgi:hypothetical protein